MTSPTETPLPKTARLPEELVASTLFLLKRLGFAAKDRTLKAYEGIGLHPYHYAILVVLEQGSPETQGSIADSLGYDRGQLVGLIDELEERGLVERRRDPNDRRRQLVRLTAEGKKKLRRVRALAAEIEEDFLSPLSEKERATLHGLLLQLAEKHEPRCGPVATRG